MTRKISIVLLVLGGAIFILSGYSLIKNITTTKEEIIKDVKSFFAKEGIYNNDSAENALVQEMEASYQIERIISTIMLLIGAGIAYGGFSLYRRVKKKFKLSDTSKFEVLFKKQNKILITASIVFLILFIFTFYLATSAESPLLFFLLLFWAFGILYSVRELIFFNYNFEDVNRHLVNWEYPNGDELIITCWGLMKYNQTVPKLSVSNRFEGFKWGLDNAKDLAENFIKNEGNPLMSLLPSIEFSTTSNRIDDYIPFSFVDKIDLTFIDKDEGYLIINIEKKNYKTKYTLTYPLPPSKESLESEFRIYESRINKRRTPVRGLYIEKSLIEDILNEK